MATVAERLRLTEAYRSIDKAHDRLAECRARLAEMTQELGTLNQRIAALEAKRGPGRPRNADRNTLSGD
jgi:DNA repair exonuclease SbcCD ATPase subunit